MKNKSSELQHIFDQLAAFLVENFEQKIPPSDQNLVNLTEVADFELNLNSMQVQKKKQKDETYFSNKNTLIINDSSLISLKFKIQTEYSGSYDNMFYKPRNDQNTPVPVFLYVEFSNHEDADRFLNQLYEKNVYRYWVRIPMYSTIVEIGAFYSENLNIVLEESKQFTKAIELLCEDKPHLKSAFLEFSKNNFSHVSS